MISKTRADSAPSGHGEERTGVVDAVDVEPRFGEEVRVPSLAAWDVENSRTGREAE
jgi:hypothetical protein